MFLDQLIETVDVCLLGDFFQVGHAGVAACGEVALLVENKSDTATHACSKVAASHAENDHAATGHVFTTVITHAFDDGIDAAVTDGETLASHAAQEEFTTRRTIKRGVTGNDVFFSGKGAACGWINHDAATTETFSDVVIAVAFQLQRDAFRHKGSKALTGTAVEVQVNRVFWQAMPVTFGDLVTEDGADGSVDVTDLNVCFDWGAILNGVFAQRQQRGDIQAFVDAVILRLCAEATDLWADFRAVKQLREVETFGFPMFNGFAGFQHVRAANHVF